MGTTAPPSTDALADAAAGHGAAAAAPAPSLSVFRKRVRKFRSLKRGYWSFLVLVTLYAGSFLLPLIMNSKAIALRYEGQWYFPLLTFHPGKTFGQFNEHVFYGESEANYRLLKARFAAEGKGNWVLLPPIPYDPIESPRDREEERLVEAFRKGDFSADLLTPAPGADASGDGTSGGASGGDDAYAGDDDEAYMGDADEEYAGDGDEEYFEEKTGAALDQQIAESPPFAPSRRHWLGTDDRGRDVLVRLAYGFNVSMTFAVVLTLVAYAIGILAGAVLGFFGGRVDLFGQRTIEVWQTVPFLFTVMILAAALSDLLSYRPTLPNVLQPRFLLLVAITAAFSWMSMSYYVRGEFLREKSRDYVAAAVATGTRDGTIMLRHILPNALTPVITYAPFTLVADISVLVALDYLGFGLPAPTPSWGELMKQALPEHMKAWWLSGAPIGALFLTLLLIVFVGEAVREAFDPKVYSRLR